MTCDYRRDGRYDSGTGFCRLLCIKRGTDDPGTVSGSSFRFSSGKMIRWICSLILILYSCIAIFVLAVTVLDSLKTKGNPISNFVGLLKEISFSSYASVLIGYFMVGMTVPVQVSILPITKPVIFTMALITAIGQWNDFYMPMVLPGDKNVTTLTLAIYRYVGQFTKYKSGFMAAVVITLIPIIILYFAFSS